jgi:hypothetical protein
MELLVPLDHWDQLDRLDRLVNRAREDQTDSLDYAVLTTKSDQLVNKALKDPLDRRESVDHVEKQGHEDKLELEVCYNIKIIVFNTRRNA